MKNNKSKRSLQNLEFLAQRYHESIDTIHMLNIQRIGLVTNFDNSVVKTIIKFKDFKGNVLHKPIINNPFSQYSIIKNKVFYLDNPINIDISHIEEDDARPYYFRGDKILVINSTFLNPCNQGCLFCEQSNAPQEKRRYSIVIGIENLFNKLVKDEKLKSLKSLTQISLVTSCAGNEKRALTLAKRYLEEARKREFNGKFLFATNEIRSKTAIEEYGELGDVILAFTIECFGNREKLMPSKKGKITLRKIKSILKYAKEVGIETTYFYIFGLDNLKTMEKGFRYFKDSITIAPTGPNYQPQGRINIITPRRLKYFLEAKKIYVSIHKGMRKFESCQNFRSLWPLENNLTRNLVR
jgi:hypothetical protein